MKRFNLTRMSRNAIIVICVVLIILFYLSVKFVLTAIGDITALILAATISVLAFKYVTKIFK